MGIASVWTNDGRNEILKVMTNQSTKYIEKFIIGDDNTTTPLVTDTALNSKIGAFTAKAFDSGFPTFDTANQKMTIRGTVSSTEANGNDIEEAALVDDGDTLIFTHDTFTSITKNSSTEIILSWTVQLQNG